MAIVPFLDLPGVICRGSDTLVSQDDFAEECGKPSSTEEGCQEDEAAEELIMDSDEGEVTMDCMDCT